MRAAVITILIVLMQSMVMLRAQSGNGFRLRSLPLEYEYQHRVTLMPVGLVIAYARANTTIGCSYEYMFDRVHGISFYLPFAYGYKGAEQQLYDSHDLLSTTHTSWHFAPGVRVHTGKGQSKSDFATGPGIVLGRITAATYFRSPSYPYYTVQIADNYGLLGLVLDNSLDYSMRHLMLGLTARIGMLAEQHDYSAFFFAAGVAVGLRY